MGSMILNQILVTPLKRIPVPAGDVLHALKCTDDGFKNFGEAYFSIVKCGAIKAWKMHTQMTLNLIVPVGQVRFVFRTDDDNNGREELIGVANYSRLTVPPGIWFGFQGLATPSSLVLNIANIPHDPGECLHREINEIPYCWETN